MSTDGKILNKTLAHWIQEYIQRITNHDQVGFDMYTQSVDMTMSIDAKKASDSSQHPFMRKTFNKLDTQGKHLNIIKTIYNKSTANIILNSEKKIMELLKLKKSFQDTSDLSKMTSSFTFRNGINI